jgi:hypothetical protein
LWYHHKNLSRKSQDLSDRLIVAQVSYVVSYLLFINILNVKLQAKTLWFEVNCPIPLVPLLGDGGQQADWRMGITIFPCLISMVKN